MDGGGGTTAANELQKFLRDQVSAEIAHLRGPLLLERACALRFGLEKEDIPTYVVRLAERRI